MNEFEKLNLVCNLDETKDHKVARFVVCLDVSEDHEEHNSKGLIEAAKKDATMGELLGYGDSSLMGSSKIGICVYMVTHT